MKAVDIDWDVDYEEQREFLPTEIEIPDDIEDDEIGDYLSDVTGFCHNGYRLERKLIVPCNICIKRFYRGYVKVDENATDEEIRKAMVESILKYQDAELIEDPDIEIEEHDITAIKIDHDCEWTEDENEDIKRILNKGE